MKKINNSVNDRISKILIRAKQCSDRGHKNGNYLGKDALIKEAIGLIDQCFNYINWRYYVSNGIVYFDTKESNGKRFQISFHIFGSLAKMNGRGRPTTWSGRRHRHSMPNKKDREDRFYKVLNSLVEEN